MSEPAGILGPGKYRQLTEAGYVCVKRETLREVANTTAHIANISNTRCPPDTAYVRMRAWRAAEALSTALGREPDSGWPILEDEAW